MAPDFKTIANFRQDNGEAIRRVCREFVMLCRKLNLFQDAFVAIDGSKFKAVNTRDRNFTRAKMMRHLQQIAVTSGAKRSWPGDLKERNEARQWTSTGPRRTPVRYTKNVDGLHPLPDEDTAQSQYRNEPAVLAYNMKRLINLFGVQGLVARIQAV